MNAATPNLDPEPTPNLDMLLADVLSRLGKGELIPYLGPEAVLLEPANYSLPMRPEALAAVLAKRTAVPGRLRKHLTGAAQYIENFKHRKVLKAYMLDAFAQPAVPSGLHRWLASLDLPLLVDTGYDAAMAVALHEAQGHPGWGQVQGVSRSENVGHAHDHWVNYYDAEGNPAVAATAHGWPTLLYKPLGSVQPAGHFLVSDSDFVEVLTEIDIQTPIPAEVQLRRSGRGFLFLGCRFDDQLARTYARQVMKRSGGRHYALLAEEPTRNEAKFIAEQGIVRLPVGVKALLAALPTAEVAP
jgi:hypothetical protein